MPGIEKKPVTIGIVRLIRMIIEKLGEEYVYKIGSAHCAAGMSGLCFFYHRSGKNTDVVCRTIHVFNFVHDSLVDSL